MKYIWPPVRACFQGPFLVNGRSLLSHWNDTEWFVRWILVFFCGVLTGCTPLNGSRDSYSVATLYFPERIDPWTNTVNAANLINIQLYFPLLSRSSKTGLLESVFLDIGSTKAVDKSFSRYQLCLGPAVRFSDGSLIEGEDLLETLKHIHRHEVHLPKLLTFQSNKGCVRVDLEHGDTSYLDKLTGVASTLLKRQAIAARIPIGKGPYRITQWSEDTIVMDGTSDLRNGAIRRLIFRHVDSMEKAVALDLDDLNYLYGHTVPESRRQGGLRIERPNQKTYLILNFIRDSELRRQMSTCLYRANFGSVTELSLLPVPGALPMGILGHDVPFEKTIKPQLEGLTCQFSGKKRTIEFLSLHPHRVSYYSSFFDKHEPELPFKVSVRPITPEKIQDFLFKTHDEALALIGIDSTGSNAGAFGEASVFFESFLPGKNCVLPTQIPGLSRLVKRASETRDIAEKRALYQEAHALLLASGYVIPVGQYKSVQFYRPWVRSVAWQDETSGMVRMDSLEIATR